MRYRVISLAALLLGGLVAAVLGPNEDIGSPTPSSSLSGSPGSPASGAPDALPTSGATDALPAGATDALPAGATDAPSAAEETAHVPARFASDNLLKASASSLLARIDDPSSHTSKRLGALRVLAARHPASARPTLSRILRDERAPLALRVEAAKEARLANGLVSAADLLEAARPHQNDVLRLASIHALGSHPDANPVALGGLLEEESNETVRLQLVGALREIGDPAALASLEACARADDASGPLRVALYQTGREMCFRSNLPLGAELSRLGPTH